MTEMQRPESIGERLRKARLRKKVTIDQAYKDTKIHPKILTALEEDRYEEFLNPTYIKAFIKSYCRYLEVSANKFLEDYDKLPREATKPVLGVAKAETNISISKPMSKIDWRGYVKRGRKWALPVLAGIVAVFLTIFLIALAGRAVSKLKNIKIAKPKAKAEAERVPAEKPIRNSSTKPLSIPEEQVLLLTIRTKGDVWLDVKCDGKTMFKNVMPKGSSETYKAGEKIELWTGKGEFLDLTLNDNALGSPGNGVIRDIVLTHKGLKVEKK